MVVKYEKGQEQEHPSAISKEVLHPSLHLSFCQFYHLPQHQALHIHTVLVYRPFVTVHQRMVRHSLLCILYLKYFTKM